MAPLVTLGGLPLIPSLAIFFGLFATSGLVTYVLRAIDPNSVVSLRRVFGLAFVSNLLWLIPLAIGSASYLALHSRQPVLNEFILGAFLAWSFELLVINGAFVPSTAASLCISAVQPIVTVLLAAPYIVSAGPSTAYAAVLGVAMLGVTLTFLLRFKMFKTEGAGITSLQTFQAFLKTWVAHNPKDLEDYFTRYSAEQPVETEVVLASARDRAALVLPGVHPGPFFPVGSYDISELIFHELRKGGITPIVLHGVGGHERNLPTNELAKRYAATVAGVAESAETGRSETTMRGPTRLQFGPVNVTTIGFGSHVLAFLSNAPYNTDDLEPAIASQAASAAKGLSVDLILVDAHNSIGGKNCAQPAVDWGQVFSAIAGSPEEEFEVGVAHSSELQFEHGTDISDGGITALVFRKEKLTHALIASDSNNVLLGVRQKVLDELKADNVDLIELCTSDTHDSAARSLTDRGYRALGEGTPPDSIVEAIKKLEKLAESKLSPGRVTAVSSRQTLPLIGEKSLDDFALLTRQALGFAKPYAGAALVSAVAMCFIAVLV